MFENFSEMMLELFAISLWETMVMVGISGLVGGLLGIPLGVFLRLTDDGGVLENGTPRKTDHGPEAPVYVREAPEPVAPVNSYWKYVTWAQQQQQQQQ